MRHFSQPFFALALTVLLLPAGYLQASVKESLKNVATDQLQSIEKRSTQVFTIDPVKLEKISQSSQNLHVVKGVEKILSKFSKLGAVLSLVKPENVDLTLNLLSIVNNCKD